ncbi:MAG: class I SAM-dependent methyltransferase [Pseudomonadales bacterium]
MSDALLLLRRFLSSPFAVAALAPSSAALAGSMVSELKLDAGASILELGPGTGALTAAIAPLLQRTPGARYLGIERDPQFCTHLRERFPHLRFAESDARDTKRVCLAEDFARVDVIICAIPLILLDPSVHSQILTDCHELLADGGEFRALSYLHSWPRRGARALRSSLREIFANTCIRGPIWLNLPPALILRGFKNPD